MEPQLPTPNLSPEMGDYQRREVPSVTPEHVSQPKIEVQPNSTERVEIRQDQPQADPIAIPALPAQPFLPTPSSATVQPVADDASSRSNPMVANDDGLIEKEWIDKAKKIVERTKDDPYTQEHEVSKLQADYIKKRYGKDVKLPS